MQSTIQKAATPTVIRVNMSPALVPKALCPPMPPRAPARPPPRPRCTSTSRIRKSDVKTSVNPRNMRTSVIMETAGSGNSQGGLTGSGGEARATRYRRAGRRPTPYCRRRHSPGFTVGTPKAPHNAFRQALRRTPWQCPGNHRLSGWHPRRARRRCRAGRQDRPRCRASRSPRTGFSPSRRRPGRRARRGARG